MPCSDILTFIRKEAYKLTANTKKLEEKNETFHIEIDKVLIHNYFSDWLSNSF